VAVPIRVQCFALEDQHPSGVGLNEDALSRAFLSGLDGSLQQLLWHIGQAVWAFIDRGWGRAVWTAQVWPVRLLDVGEPVVVYLEQLWTNLNAKSISRATIRRLVCFSGDNSRAERNRRCLGLKYL
jgi:hypothetical protein